MSKPQPDGVYRCPYCGEQFTYDDFVSGTFEAHEDACVEVWDDVGERLTRVAKGERN
jgi:hypothetical protein